MPIWTLILVTLAVALLLLIVYLIELVRKHVTGVPQGDIGVLSDAIDGVRRHMASNHDETDGELRRIAEAQESIAREARAANTRIFEKELADELAKAKAVAAERKDDTQ